jgi:hypothetical protein
MLSLALCLRTILIIDDAVDEHFGNTFAPRLCCGFRTGVHRRRDDAPVHTFHVRKRTGRHRALPSARTDLDRQPEPLRVGRLRLRVCLLRGKFAEPLNDSSALIPTKILTGKAPFFEIPRDVTVSIRVLEGLRPSRPETMLHEELWPLLQDCWEAKPGMRPDITRIVRQLITPPIRATTTQSTTDWDEAFSSKVRRSLQDWPLLPSVSGIERRVFGDGMSSLCPYLRDLTLFLNEDAVEGEESCIYVLRDDD